MPARMGLPRPGRPKGKDLAAGAVVLAFLMAVCILGAGIFIAHSLKPTDGRFGVPQYLVFPFCGRSYMLGADTAPQTFTRADASAGAGAFVVEPTIGSIPLLSLLTCPRSPSGLTYTVIWLHVGTDAYVEYALEGGP
jgi:hypothetical protein